MNPYCPVRAHHILCPIALLLAFGLEPVANAQQQTVEEVLSQLAVNPTVEQVQQAALRHAALQPGGARRLLSRVRCAGLLPRVETSLARGLSRDEDLDREFQEPDDLSLATDQDLDFRLSLRWDLDRLIYDPEELRARREVAYQAQRRRELLLAVTRLYYELLLLRAQQLVAGQGAESSSLSIDQALRMAELRALLDGMTDGLYSRARAGGD